jgi:uncharacterized protein YggT (Ycf19 family)
MSLIDFISNLAGLLLWLNWRAIRFDPLAKTTPATLTGTLRRAAPSRFRRWHLLAALAGLLLLRALLYWQIGSAVNWTATLELGAIAISFRSDFFGRALLFSLCSFAVAMAVTFLWLLFLSLLKRPSAESDALQQLVRAQLGRVDNWPRSVKTVLPLVAAAIAWWLMSWPFARWAMVPQPATAVQRLEQALVVGLGSYLAWKSLIVAVLLLHVVNSYIYFGNQAFWNYLNGLARRLLAPLRHAPLRVGRVDFAPVLAIVLVFLFANFAEHGFKSAPRIDAQGKRQPPLIEIPGLVDLYRAVSR